MTAYIHASLYGTEADDVLAYSSEYDPDEDTFTMYTSLYGLGGNDAIQIDGSDYSLYIDAGEGDDRIIGDQGFFSLPDVTVYAGAGDDVVQYLVGEYNGDTELYGGEGYDALIFAGRFDASRMTGFETLVVYPGELRILEGQLSGFDMVDIESQAITFEHSADLTNVHFSDSENKIVVNGSSAADNFDLSGQSRDFSITGNGGADVIIAGAGRLFAEAGAGLDYLKGGDRDDILNAGGRNSAAATGAMETVLGMGGNDIVIFAGARAEYDGGEGVDVFKLANARPVVDVSDSSIANFEILQLASYTRLLVDGDFLDSFQTIAGPGKIAFADSTTLDHFPEFSGRSLILHGSDEDDSFSLKDFSVKIIFTGGGGNDLYRAGATAVNLSGDDGNDSLFGSSAKDEISGDAGDDQLVGGDGNDNLRGNAGNDTLVGGEGADTLDGGNGLDILHGGAGNDHLNMRSLTISDSQTLDGGAGNDSFVYGSYLIVGQTPKWILHQAAEIDVVGGAGQDSLVISGNLRGVSAKGVESLEFYNAIWATPEFLSGFDKIDATSDWSKPEAYIHLTSSGKFTWSGADINAMIFAADGNDVFDFSKAGALEQSIFLGNGDDIFRFGAGGSGDGSVAGEAGNDASYSGKGDDRFNGEAGDDIFVAGGGNDTFIGSYGNDTYVAAGNIGIDRFEDFEVKGTNTDVIDLSGIKGIRSFQDLIDHSIKTDRNGEVYIDMGVHGTLFFTETYEVDRLTEANFLF
jgi:Ca2+-binding RTX toxin-like protein